MTRRIPPTSSNPRKVRRPARGALPVLLAAGLLVFFAAQCLAGRASSRTPTAFKAGLRPLIAVETLAAPGVADMVQARSSKTDRGPERAIMRAMARASGSEGGGFAQPFDAAGSAEATEESAGAGPPAAQPFQFAEAYTVDVSPGLPASLDKSSAIGEDAGADAMGTWEELDSGNWVWRLRVSSEGAKSLNFGFTTYHMPEGGTLFVYAVNGSQVYGPFTAGDNEIHGQLWTPPIRGDEAVIEATLPGDKVADLDLVLGSVNQGYVDFEGLDKSGSCNVDVICSEGDGWRDQIRSVARILISGRYVCTGALMETASRNNIPYFLTANHCEVTESSAPSLVVTWNFEETYCRSGANASNPGDGSLDDYQTGAILRAAYEPSDMTLVELDDPVSASFNAFFAGWDNTGANPTAGTAIHHPAGDEKRISQDNDALTTTSYLESDTPGDGTHFRVSDWDWGTTEGGSSGSPLFDQNKRVTGQLHGGDASCGFDLPDWYGKLSVSWEGGGTPATRLKDWLDPENSGVSTVDGRDVPSCTFTLSTYSMAASLGVNSVTVKASDEACAWTATTSDSWITVNTPSGTGGGTASFTLGETNATRSGSLTIAGHTLEVTQPVSVIPALGASGVATLALLLCLCAILGIRLRKTRHFSF